MGGDADLKDAPACPDRATDRRLVQRILQHWIALRRTDQMPSIDNLDISALPAPWERCFLLTRTDARAPVEFDHLGDAFTADRLPAAGNRLDAVRPGSLLDYATRMASRVISERAPTLCSGSVVPVIRRHIRFRSIILPFDGRTTGNFYLLGAANWRDDAFGSPRDLEDMACYIFDQGDWRPTNPPSGVRGGTALKPVQ